MAAGKLELEMSEEDRRLGDISFIHRAHTRQRKPAGQAEGYTQLTGQDESPEKRLDVVELILEDPDAAAAAAAAPGCCESSVFGRFDLCSCCAPGCNACGARFAACCPLGAKLCAEANIAMIRAVESWQTFLVELVQMRNTLWMAVGEVVQWGFPAFAVMFSVIMQSFSARLATLYYIRYMTRLEEVVKVGHKDLDPLSAEWIYQEHFDYPQKLQDIFASFMEEPLDVPAYLWDVTLFPLTLLCLSAIISCRDVYMWSKVCFCFVMLNLGRAICHVSTVVPDSQGWESCKERLTNFGAEPEALKDMAHMTINWRTAAMGSMFEVLEAEAKGMRYCGDMIYSGQTFVMLLFALGLLEVLRRHFPDHWKCRGLVGFLAFSFTLVASAGALAARYHYTIDVFLGGVLTMLWYDSATVAAWCEWWAGIAYDAKSAQKVFVPDRKTAPKVSTFGLLQGSFMYVLELGMICWVASDFYKAGDQALVSIYLGTLGVTSFVLMIFSFYMFQTDASLRAMPICVRFPLALILGVTHLIFLVAQFQSYRRKQITEESFIIKVFKASLQSAPLAFVQLHALVMFHRGDIGDIDEDAGLMTKVFVWKRYAQMILSFFALGEAVALFDAMRSSVLEEIVRNVLWRSLLAGLRTAEVTSRIACLVVIHCFAEMHGYRWVGPALSGIDLLLSAILVRCLGVARKFLAVVLFSVVSFTSNVYLFQRDQERRRLADILLSVRTAEFFFLFAGLIWYFKFYPGGMAVVLDFAMAHKVAVGLMVVSYLLYFMMLAVWLGIRRSQLPREWDNQDQDMLLEE